MRILVLDIETSPIQAYTWGLFNQNISINQIVEDPRILCWGAKWHGEKGPVLYSSEFADGRTEMLAQLHALLSEADAVAHWNGESFDMPWIQAELKVEGFDPLPPLIQVDLMRVVKKHMRFPSRKLDYVAGRLQSRHKVKHEGFGMWVKCLNGDARAWSRMVRYMCGDVILTDRLLTDLKPFVTKLNVNLTAGTTDACPRCGSTRVQRRGTKKTSLSVFQQFQCQACRGWFRSTKREHGASVVAIA